MENYNTLKNIYIQKDIGVRDVHNHLKLAYHIIQAEKKIDFINNLNKNIIYLATEH